MRHNFAAAGAYYHYAAFRLLVADHGVVPVHAAWLRADMRLKLLNHVMASSFVFPRFVRV